MKLALSRRLTVLLWLLIIAAALVIYLNAESNRITKVSALFIGLIAWRGVFVWMWPHRRLRWVLPGLTLLTAGFLLLPLPSRVPAETLRTSYTASLRAYEDVPYYWGGESRRGIDCSGLIRCGLMNTLFQRGLGAADSRLVRESLSMWWSDTSAEALGKEHRGLTKRLFQAPSINEADHSRLFPGDLAVTVNGVHILAYLGNHEWIQANPKAGRVIRSRVPVTDDAWFTQPVNLLRWQVLHEP